VVTAAAVDSETTQPTSRYAEFPERQGTGKPRARICASLARATSGFTEINLSIAFTFRFTNKTACPIRDNKNTLA
jgi:hypothetical protein